MTADSLLYLLIFAAVVLAVLCVVAWLTDDPERDDDLDGCHYWVDR